MKKSTRNWIVLLATSLPVMWIAWTLTVDDDGHVMPANSVTVKVAVGGGKDRADLVRNDDGTYTYLLWRGDASEKLTPDQLADRLYRQQSTNGVLATIFNVSSPLGLIWVGVGLLGQVLFTGRMLVQWLASEKYRRSVVPTMFWWFSVVGALMLLAYFLWRRDIVGVLGQSFGMFIYIRNLHLIYRVQRRTAALIDATPGTELG